MNDLTMADLKVGSVALMYGNRMVVVVGVNPNKPKNCISYKQQPNSTTYIAAVSDFTKVIGQVDMNAFNAVVIPKDPVENKGTDFVPSWDSTIPQRIKDMNLKIGDTILVRHGAKPIQILFQGFNWNRPKYPLCYSVNGKNWKGSLSMILSKVEKTA